MVVMGCPSPRAPGKALILALWGTVVVGGIDNLLYPMLVGNRMRMHTVLVFISLVGGLFVFGAAGLILGPVVLTVTTVLLEVWRHQNADPIPVAAPPVLLAQLATLPRADFWPRLGALLIDIVLVAVAGGVSLVLAWLPFPLLFGGYVFGLWLWKGTTVGGIVFNLKVVRLDGRPIDAATAMVRTLVAFLSVCAAGLGFLWCLWDDERQTWHDKVAGTVVVRVPKATPLV